MCDCSRSLETLDNPEAGMTASLNPPATWMAHRVVSVLSWLSSSHFASPETEWRRRMASKKGEEEDEDLTEEMKNLRELQKQELSKVWGGWDHGVLGDGAGGLPWQRLIPDPHVPSPQVTSNLGKLILKEEMEKSLPIRRKTRSLPDRTPFHTCAWGWE